jgi:hypothetical protein
LGKVFLPGRCLNELPHPGQDVEVFQVIARKLAGQNAGAFGRGLLPIDEDYIPALKLTAAAVDGDLIVSQVLVADLDSQPIRKAFQVLEKSGVREPLVHIPPNYRPGRSIIPTSNTRY